jgi:hypothetical protein
MTSGVLGPSCLLVCRHCTPSLPATVFPFPNVNYRRVDSHAVEPRFIADFHGQRPLCLRGCVPPFFPIVLHLRTPQCRLYTMIRPDVTPDTAIGEQPTIGLIGMGAMGKMYANCLSAAGWKK